MRKALLARCDRWMYIARMTTATQKPGQHGTLYLYEITYRDSSDVCNNGKQRVWAYNQEHATDKFYDAPDADGWVAAKIARVPPHGLMHRAIQHEVNS
jgi:hypothetical protein